MLVLLLTTALLAGCGSTNISSVQSSPTTTSSLSPTATATPQPSATLVVTIHGDWQTYTDTKYGFRLDVPAILQTTLPPDTDTGNNHYIYWQYNFGRGLPPTDQKLFAEVSVMLFASTTGTFPCTQGTPVTIGSGVTAYEDDSLDAPTPSPGGGDLGLGGLGVNFVAGGVYFHIEFDGNPPKATFRARYGDIWQHILNSFVPGPAVPNGHPCG